jgi:hypothetical protein
MGNPERGYRPFVGEYELVQDARIPFGTARANAQYGAGGGTQFFVQDYNQSLRLIRQIPLGK